MRQSLFFCWLFRPSPVHRPMSTRFVKRPCTSWLAWIPSSRRAVGMGEGRAWCWMYMCGSLLLVSWGFDGGVLVIYTFFCFSLCTYVVAMCFYKWFHCGFVVVAHFWRRQIWSDTCSGSNIGQIQVKKLILIFLTCKQNITIWTFPPEWHQENQQQPGFAAKSKKTLYTFCHRWQNFSLSKPNLLFFSKEATEARLLSKRSIVLEVDKKGRVKDRSWKSVQKMMTDPGRFLQVLKATGSNVWSNFEESSFVKWRLFQECFEIDANEHVCEQI